MCPKVARENTRLENRQAQIKSMSHLGGGCWDASDFFESSLLVKSQRGLTYQSTPPQHTHIQMYPCECQVSSSITLLLIFQDRISH